MRRKKIEMKLLENWKHEKRQLVEKNAIVENNASVEKNQLLKKSEKWKVWKNPGKF